MCRATNSAEIPRRGPKAAHPSHYTERHDNVQPHTTRHATAYLMANNTQALPSKSPDLKPMEHLWGQLDNGNPSHDHRRFNSWHKHSKSESANIPQCVVRIILGRIYQTVLDSNGEQRRYYFSMTLIYAYWHSESFTWPCVNCCFLCKIWMFSLF